MAKQIKTRKGKDDYYYPYTSPDLVIDNTGKSATTRFEEIEDNQLNLIEDGTTKGIKDTEYDTLTTTNKTVIGSINELSTQFKDIANLFSTEQTVNSYKIKCGNKIIAEIPLGSTEPSPPTKSKYTVTNNLTNATNNNSISEIKENEPYTATITANSKYTLSSVTVTMGGTDITSSCYNNGVINISAVTGNIIITASAVLQNVSISNELLLDMDISEKNNGKSSFTENVSNETFSITTENEVEKLRIGNKNVNVDELKAEGSLTVAYTFDKNRSKNANVWGVSLKNFYDATTFGWDSYQFAMTLFYNDNASTSLYSTGFGTVGDLRKLPDISSVIFIAKKDGSVDIYLNGEFYYNYPKADNFKSWNVLYNSLKDCSINGDFSKTTPSLYPVNRISIYKGEVSTDKIKSLHERMT